MRNQLSIISILFFLGACSNPKLFTVTTFDSAWPWETIAISRTSKENVKMLQLFRNTTGMESKRLDFEKTDRNHYLTTDGQQRIEFKKSVALLQRENQLLSLPKVKNSPEQSSKEMVEEILDEQYIVHSNIHQRTFFDCQKNSNCYIIKYCEQLPYDTSIWFLSELEGELFLSYRNAHVFHRVYADDGGLVFTYGSGVDEVIVYKPKLSAKKAGTLCR